MFTDLIQMIQKSADCESGLREKLRKILQILHFHCAVCGGCGGGKRWSIVIHRIQIGFGFYVVDVVVAVAKSA